eukprot:5736396-Amphidinium_carterae.1
MRPKRGGSVPWSASRFRAENNFVLSRAAKAHPASQSHEHKALQLLQSQSKTLVLWNVKSKGDFQNVRWLFETFAFRVVKVQQNF